MYIRYTLYFWTPPVLTIEQEVAAGRQIAAVGREEYLRLHAPFLSQAAPGSPQGKRVAILLLCLIVGALILFAPIAFWVMLLVASPIILLSMGSLLVSRNRHRQWVDEVMGKYRAYEAGLPITYPHYPARP